MVLGLGLGSDSALGRQLKIASVESYVDSVDSGSSRSFSSNQDLFDGIYTYEQLHEEIADEETQRSKKMRSDPQFDGDQFPGCSGLIHQPLPREDDPILSPAVTYETGFFPSQLP